MLCYGGLMALCVVALFSMLYGYGEFVQNRRIALKEKPVEKFYKPSASHRLDDMLPRRVRFVYEDETAGEVFLYADFNLWGAHEIKLEKGPRGGFSKTIVLPQGEYRYYYFVDGKPAADAQAARSSFYKGQEVSVKTVL